MDQAGMRAGAVRRCQGATGRLQDEGIFSQQEFMREDETLLIWGDTFLVLDLSLHILDGVRGLDIKGDGLTGEGLNEDLHTTAKSED